MLAAARDDAATASRSGAIPSLAALGFLGFGIEPTSAAEWGYDLNRSISDVTSGIWWTSIFPGLAIVLIVLGITLIVGGACYLVDMIAAFVAPGLSTQIHGLLAIPPTIAEIWMLGYLLAIGVRHPASGAPRIGLGKQTTL